MKGKPVNYHNRYSGVLEEEAIYGEQALRFSCETAVGRLLSRLVLARPLISRAFGWYMKRPGSARKIQPFIERYGINAGEFREPVEAFRSFNDFFRRELRPECRPVDPDSATVVFPADGRHLGCPRLGLEERLFIKGQRWNLNALLDGDRELCRIFSGGTLVLSRLCPVDYHHFHSPLEGEIQESRWVKGPLYSVNPVSLRGRIGALWENFRCLTLMRSEIVGRVCFIQVGATNVGSIRHRPQVASGHIGKGDPMGWFEFGGSAVVTLFEPGRIQLSPDLVEQSAKGIELYAHVGDQMGRIHGGATE